MTNILQHKSWHVWNRENRAKVEKDVAAHKESEEKKRKRVLEIEQEIRYTALKDKSKKRREDIEREGDDPDAYKRAIAIIPNKESDDSHVDEKPQHINFFADIEAGQGQLVAGDKNAEYEAEKKEEKEKEDRKNTNYLVPPQTSDFKVIAPWYALVPSGNTETELPEPPKNEKEAKEAKEAELKKKKDERLKNKEDPLQAMNKYLGAKKTAKKFKKEQEKEETKVSSIAKLREERLKREAEERKKVSQLLYGNKEKEKSAESSRNSSGYNNSFLNYSGGVLRDPNYHSHRHSSNRNNSRY